MQLIPIIVATMLGFSTGASAWAQAANGEWIAHNTFETIQGRYMHQACTTRTGDLYREAGPCKYWWDDKGTIHHGECGAEPDNNDAGYTILCFI
ncbi:hypothetical protein CC79DRAFT_1373970 [Sarocladium strictum]